MIHFAPAAPSQSPRCWSSIRNRMLGRFATAAIAGPDWLKQHETRMRRRSTDFMTGVTVGRLLLDGESFSRPNRRDAMNTAREPRPTVEKTGRLRTGKWGAASYSCLQFSCLASLLSYGFAVLPANSPATLQHRDRMGGQSNGFAKVNRGQRLGGHGLRLSGNVDRAQARPINPPGLRCARERAGGGLQRQHDFLSRRVVHQAKREAACLPVKGSDGIHWHLQRSSFTGTKLPPTCAR